MRTFPSFHSLNLSNPGYPMPSSGRCNTMIYSMADKNTKRHAMKYTYVTSKVQYRIYLSTCSKHSKQHNNCLPSLFLISWIVYFRLRSRSSPCSILIGHRHRRRRRCILLVPIPPSRTTPRHLRVIPLPRTLPLPAEITVSSSAREGEPFLLLRYL